MVRKHYVDNSPATQLVATIDNSVLSFAVGNLAGFPGVFPYPATIDRGTATAEQVLVTGAVGSTVTVTRNYNGQGAFGHNAQAAFEHTATSVDFDENNAHLSQTTGVHGATGALVDTGSVQTLNSKTLNSPTLNTPTVTGTLTAAAVTATNITASGIVEVGRLIVDTVVALPSATPGVQFGAQGGFNIQASSRAIQAMNNAGVSDLNLNAAGGNIQVGGTGSAITIGTGSTTTTVSGTLSVGTLGVTANATVGGTLGVTGLATLANGTVTGTLGVTGTITGTRQILTATGALPSATPALQIGAQATTNLQMSATAIQAVNNTVASALTLNGAGGAIALGSAASTVTVAGTLALAGKPNDTSGNPLWQSGTSTVSFTSLNFTTINITFTVPFTATPNVYCNIASGAGATSRWGVRAISVSTTGFQIFLFYSADATTTATWASVPVQWTAIAP
jgi:hypothetical protein